MHFASSFVFLPKLVPYYPFKCHLIRRFVKVRSHGPAVTLTLTNYRNGKSYSIDLVPAIKQKTWPEDANEWIARQRRGTRKRSFVVSIREGVKMDKAFCFPRFEEIIPCFHGQLNLFHTDIICYTLFGTIIY